MLKKQPWYEECEHSELIASERVADWGVNIFKRSESSSIVPTTWYTGYIVGLGQNCYSAKEILRYCDDLQVRDGNAVGILIEFPDFAVYSTIIKFIIKRVETMKNEVDCDEN